MVTMASNDGDAAVYQARATQYLALAQAALMTTRLGFRDVARTWLLLAELAQKNGQTVLEYEIPSMERPK